MDDPIQDGYTSANTPPQSPLQPVILETLKGLVVDNNGILDFAELAQVAERSYDGSCDEMVLCLIRLIEHAPQSRLRVAKALGVLGYLLLFGSEELVVVAKDRQRSLTTAIEIGLNSHPLEDAVEMTAFVRERADALMRILSDPDLLSTTRNGVFLALSPLLGRKDHRSGLSPGMTDSPECHGSGTEVSTLLEYRVKFSDMDLTEQVSVADSAPVTSSCLSEIRQGDWVSGEGQPTKVALKVVIRYPQMARKKDIERCMKEISIWRELQHENILPFYGLCWMSNGVPALVSPWCDHGDINRYVERCKPGKPDIDGLKLELLHQVLHGLEYLHGKDVVHGDVKGANVVVTTQGVARLCDFGFTFLVDDSGSLSSRSTMPGTRRWMAPELLKGMRTISADIWAFGCLVLEVQSERKPFHTVDSDDSVIVELSKDRTPPRPKGFPDRLWWLALQTWQIGFAARPKATALSSQMDTLRTIYASDPAAWTRTTIPQSFTELPFAVIERVLGAELGHKKTIDQLLSAISLQALYLLFSTAEGQKHLLSNFKRVPDYASTVLRVCIDGARRRRSWPLFEAFARVATDFLRQQCPEGHSKALQGEGPVLVSLRSAMTFSPRPGSEIVHLARLLASPPGGASSDTYAWVTRYLPSALKMAALRGHIASVDAVAFTPDGTRILSGSKDNELRIWDARNGALVHTLSRHVSGITCLAACASRMTSGGSDGSVYIWDIAGGDDIAGRLTQSEATITCVAICSDGSRAASSSRDGTLCLRDANTGRLLRVRKGERDVKQLAFSTDGTCLAAFSATSAQYTLLRLDARKLRPVGTIVSHTPPWKDLSSCALSPDLTRVVIGQRGGEVVVVDILSGDKLAQYQHGWNPVRNVSVEAIAFSSCGTRVASCCSINDTVRIYDVDACRFVCPALELEAGLDTPTRAIAFSPDGRTIATGSDDRCVRIWDATGRWQYSKKAETALETRRLAAKLSAVNMDSPGKH